MGRNGGMIGGSYIQATTTRSEGSMGGGDNITELYPNPRVQVLIWGGRR